MHDYSITGHVFIITANIHFFQIQRKEMNEKICHIIFICNYGGKYHAE